MFSAKIKKRYGLINLEVPIRPDTVLILNVGEEVVAQRDIRKQLNLEGDAA